MKKKKINEQRLRDLWDTTKGTSIQIRAPEKRGKGAERIFEDIMVKNAPI